MACCVESYRTYDWTHRRAPAPPTTSTRKKGGGGWSADTNVYYKLQIITLVARFRIKPFFRFNSKFHCLKIYLISNLEKYVCFCIGAQTHLKVNGHFSLHSKRTRIPSQKKFSVPLPLKRQPSFLWHTEHGKKPTSIFNFL